VLEKSAAALGLLWVFTVSLLGGAVLHANLPLSRRVLTPLIEAELDATFEGRIRLGTVEAVTLRSVRLRNASVLSPEGERVLRVDRLRARGSLPNAILAALTGYTSGPIHLEHVRAEGLECQVRSGPSGGPPSIARAFAPRRRASGEGSALVPETSPLLTIDAIEVGHVWCRIAVPRGPTFEAEANKANGRLVAYRHGVDLSAEAPVVVRGLVGAEIRGSATFALNRSGNMNGGLAGFAGDLGVTGSGTYQARRMTLRVDVPKAEPGVVRALLPAWPLHETARLHAEVAGAWPDVRAKASAALGDARIVAEGPIRVSSDLSAELDLGVQALDVRSFVPAAPPTELSGRSRLVLYRGAEGLGATLNGTLDPSLFAGQRLPAVDFAGVLEKGRVEGTLTFHERGMPLKLELTREPNGALGFEVRAGGFELTQAPRVRALTRARGFTDIRATGRIEGDRLDATLRARIDSFALDGVRAQRVEADGTARGSLRDPNALDVDAKLNARAVVFGHLRYDTVRASARGRAAQPEVRLDVQGGASPSVQASGEVNWAARRVRRLEATLTRERSRLSARVGLLALEDGALRVENAELSGASGKLRGSALVSKRRVDAELSAENLDLKELTRLTGYGPATLEGRVTANVEASLGGDRESARVLVNVRDAKLASREQLSLDVQAVLENGNLTAQAAAVAPGLATLVVRSNTTLPGRTTQLDSWRDLTGRTDLDLTSVSLSELARYLPPEWLGALGVSRLAGTAELRAQLGRRNPAVLPSVTGTLQTRGLEVEVSRAGGAPVFLRDLDLRLGLSANGETGYTLATAQLRDAQGTLLDGMAEGSLDLHALVARPGELRALLRTTPLRAVVTLPERDVVSLPEFIRPSALRGRASGKLALQGSLERPLYSLQTELRQLVVPKADVPINVLSAVQYERASGRFNVNAQVTQIPSGKLALLASAQGIAPYDGLWRKASPERPRWQGEAQLVINDVPFGLLPGVTERDLEGRFERGRFTLERHGANVRFEGTTALTRIIAKRRPVGSGTLNVEVDGSRAGASLRVDSARGSFTASAATRLLWPDELPELDPSATIEALLTARSLDASAVAPFTEPVLDDLAGVLDAELKLAFTRREPAPNAPTAARWKASLDGTAQLRDGSVKLAGLGLDLDRVSLDARARSVGELIGIEVRGLQASARSKQTNLLASANLYLDNTRIVRGNASLSAKDLPLPVAGVPLATGTGVAQFTLEREPSRMRVDVEIPELVAELPRTATRSVLPVTDNPAIRVAQPLRPVSRARGGAVEPWDLVFDLGSRVRIKRTDLAFEIPVTGRPRLSLGDRTTLDGYVDLEPGGRLPIVGKVFRVDSGRVWLDPEDPTNPLLNLSASWRAPEATVYLRVRGRWESPELEFESDPAYSAEQIWTVLLGGSPDDPTGSRTGTSLQAATQAARALGMDQLLSGTPLSGLEVTPDTERGETSYRVSYAVNDRVRVEGIYAPGGGLESRSGSSVDREQRRDAFAGAIEYRFNPNWSVRTEAGNASAGLDLLWQYRY
jgi:translocation and assembly module TamB